MILWYHPLCPSLIFSNFGFTVPWPALMAPPNPPAVPPNNEPPVFELPNVEPVFPNKPPELVGCEPNGLGFVLVAPNNPPVPPVLVPMPNAEEGAPVPKVVPVAPKGEAEVAGVLLPNKLVPPVPPNGEAEDALPNGVEAAGCVFPKRDEVPVLFVAPNPKPVEGVDVAPNGVVGLLVAPKGELDEDPPKREGVVPPKVELVAPKGEADVAPNGEGVVPGLPKVEAEVPPNGVDEDVPPKVEAPNGCEVFVVAPKGELDVKELPNMYD